MLKFLYIENIAVIEKASIEFFDGFNVLTGETGAGKSIVIDSINAVLGERTSKDIIRNGCDNAVVTALFTDINGEAERVIKENGYSLDSDGNVSIQRILSLSSKNAVKLNGQPVSMAVLKEIGKMLINIHGQHDNQLLLDRDYHYTYIDKIADNKDVLSEYISEFENLNRIRKKIVSLRTDEESKLNTMDLLKYQINEIESSSVKVGEYASLKARQKTAREISKKLKDINSIIYALAGDENVDGLITVAENVNKELEKIDVDELKDEKEEMQSFCYAVSALEEKLKDLNDKLSSDEFNLEEIDTRIEIYNHLMSKYGDSEEKILKFLSDAQTKIHNIEFAEEEIKKLEEELEISKEKLIFSAEKLTKTRKNAAQRFENNVLAILKEMNMPNIRFKVSIENSRYKRTGCDEIEFLISANAGEDLKPLVKIASGGELSRVMLAIKSVLSDKDEIDTLIFDEIDSGISGNTASKVAKQMRKLSGNKQVICVTHLAQIAAAANNHYLIEKSTRDNKTFTDITLLSGEKTVSEIARIMSGVKITDNLFASAEELINSYK